MSTIAYANSIENKRADEIYQLFDSGKFLPDDEVSELLQEYKNSLASNDTVRQQLHIRLTCWSLPSDTTEQMTAAIAYADEYLKIYAQPSPSLIQVDLQLCKTWYLHNLGQNSSLFEALDRAIDNAYLLEDPRLIADGRSIRGSILSYMGNFSAALEDLITAQNLYETLNIPYWANVNLSELANSYRRFGDATTALKYQLILEQYYVDNQQKFAANRTNNEIAMSLEELGRFQEAIVRYQKTYEFWLNEKEYIFAADTSISMGGNLINLNRLDEAKLVLEQAEKQIKSDNNGNYSYMNLYLAQVHSKLNNNAQALEYIQKAEKAFIYSENARGLNQALRLKSEVYQALAQWPEAYQSLSAYVDSHEALDKQTMSDRKSEMQTRFDTHKIQTENDLLVQRDKDKEQQLQIMQRNENMQIIIIILVAIILIIVSIFAYKQLMRKQLFRRLALTDELTKLSNRRDTYSQGQHFLKVAQLSGKPFSIISFDADHFKRVNDQLGHDIGDKVLVKLASICASMMRDTDVVGRVGGEEFLVLLPNIDKTKAIEIAERLIETIAHYDWQQIAPNLAQTVSAGVASYSSEVELSPLLLKADKALYSAKAAGRNCVKSE
ncbi:tetratricopeptide repeat-containing diguanylate cyclase [Shewanella sp. MF05960]|uniref:tetratricopeptide repeat-containing diguanylate cyclase n=1 Tax=Shewanella sp. MF05960 TaxID=3434874 RepID=UPI003D79F434